MPWLLCGACLIAPLRAQADEQARPEQRRAVRTYSERIQFQERATGIALPVERRPGAPDVPTAPASSADGIQPVFSAAPLYERPPIPSRATEQGRRNWLLPTSGDDSDPTAKREPSGWGWLADELLSRQDERERRETAEQDESSDRQDTRRRDRRSEEDRNSSGLLLHSTFTPWEPARTGSDADRAPTDGPTRNGEPPRRETTDRRIAPVIEDRPDQRHARDRETELEAWGRPDHERPNERGYTDSVRDDPAISRAIEQQMSAPIEESFSRTVVSEPAWAPQEPVALPIAQPSYTPVFAEPRLATETAAGSVFGAPQRTDFGRMDGQIGAQESPTWQSDAFGASPWSGSSIAPVESSRPSLIDRNTLTRPANDRGWLAAPPQ